MTYLQLGQLQEALKLSQQALDIRREVLGDKHPATAYALARLSAVYFELRDFASALRYEKSALAICREELGSQHPETVNIIRGLTNCWLAMGQRHEALRLVREFLRESKAGTSSHTALKQLEAQILDTGGRPFQPGFRQPPKPTKSRHSRKR